MVMIPAITKPPGHPRVKNIEPLGFLLVEQGRHYRINESLNGSVFREPGSTLPKKSSIFANSGFESATVSPKTPMIAQENLADECKYHRKFVANFVDDQTEQDNTDREWPDLNPSETPDLGRIEFQQSPR